MSRGRPHTKLQVAVREPYGHRSKSDRIGLTINHKKLNNISTCQLPIPRVDEVLEKLVIGWIFHLFDLVSSLHHMTVHKDTIPPKTICICTRLFEWSVTPQGCSATPRWLVKVIHELTKVLLTWSPTLMTSSSSTRIPPFTSSPLRSCSHSYRNAISSSHRRTRRSVPPSGIFSVTPSPPRAFNPALTNSLLSRECRCRWTSNNCGPV